VFKLPKRQCSIQYGEVTTQLAWHSSNLCYCYDVLFNLKKKIILQQSESMVRRRKYSLYVQCPISNFDDILQSCMHL